MTQRPSFVCFLRFLSPPLTFRTRMVHFKRKLVLAISEEFPVVLYAKSNRIQLCSKSCNSSVLPTVLVCCYAANQYRENTCISSKLHLKKSALAKSWRELHKFLTFLDLSKYLKKKSNIFQISILGHISGVAFKKVGKYFWRRHHN